MPIAASVVVPTFQGARRLPVLLEALAVQAVRERWEVVVAVDGSTDGTMELLRKWQDRLPLVVTASLECEGVSAALSRGYDVARGEVLIRCDDDLTPGPMYVHDHLRWHSAGARVGVIGLTRNVFPPSARAFAEAYGIAADAGARREAANAHPAFRWRHWAANNSISRADWEASGGFDDRFVFGQDSEFGYRLWSSGTRLLIDPRLEVPHRGPALTARVRIPRAFVSGAARRLFDEIHGVSGAVSKSRASLKASVWGLNVMALARLERSRDGFERLGRTLDSAIQVAPQPLAFRMVALAVEAAAVSGYRNGSSDLAPYRRQKLHHLADEEAAASTAVRSADAIGARASV